MRTMITLSLLIVATLAPISALAQPTSCPPGQVVKGDCCVPEQKKPETFEGALGVQEALLKSVKKLELKLRGKVSRSDLKKLAEELRLLETALRGKDAELDARLRKIEAQLKNRCTEMIARMDKDQLVAVNAPDLIKQCMAGEVDINTGGETTREALRLHHGVVKLEDGTGAFIPGGTGRAGKFSVTVTRGGTYKLEMDHWGPDPASQALLEEAQLTQQRITYAGSLDLQLNAELDALDRSDVAKWLGWTLGGAAVGAGLGAGIGYGMGENLREDGSTTHHATRSEFAGNGALIGAASGAAIGALIAALTTSGDDDAERVRLKWAEKKNRVLDGTDPIPGHKPKAPAPQTFGTPRR